MKLSLKTTDAVPFQSGSRGPFAELFHSLMLELNENKSSRDYGKIWSKIAPAGNIYRYNALVKERLKHCLDLEDQMRELAVKYEDLLGKGTTIEHRVEELTKLLRTTKVTGTWAFDLEEQDSPISKEGYMPLLEFLDSGGQMSMGLVPKDPEELKNYRRNTFFAYVCFMMQMSCPLLVLVTMWQADSNLLRHPQKFTKHLNWDEFLCTGVDTATQLTTVVGTLFLLMIYTIIYNYAADELAHAEKTGKLPADGWWSVLSSVANGFCCFVICLAIPLEFWGEDGATGIIMNAMALLFIFTLDDFGSDMFGYLGTDDATFQRQVAWNYALLAHCPVDISSLINSHAQSKEELWQIAFDRSARLLQAHPAGVTSTPRLCTTRIQGLPADESTPLARLDTDSAGAAHADESDLDDLRSVYRRSRDVKDHKILPGPGATFFQAYWSVVVFLVSVIWYVVPIVWFTVNKPCVDYETG